MILKFLNSLIFPRKKSVRRSRVQKLFVAGKVYNLKEIFEEMNSRYFENKLDMAITWTNSAQREAFTRRRLGSYHPRQKLIRIHRILDQPQIPSYFISYIVYHEMLHHVCPPQRRSDGKRWIHHPTFKAREKEFEHFMLATQLLELGKDRF